MSSKDSLIFFLRRHRHARQLADKYAQAMTEMRRMRDDMASLTRWVAADGEPNVYPDDQVLDQGEMCDVKRVEAEKLDDGSYWMHVYLQDPRDTDGRVFCREFSGCGLVAVRSAAATTRGETR